MNFLERIRSKPAPIGTILTTPSTDVAEVISNAGFDWLFLDLEHGTFSMSEAQQVLQVVAGRVPVIVRVPENAETWFKKTLDLGADGVIVPQVNNADLARAAVRAAKYPPAGVRSVGIARASGFGQNFADYVARANDTAVVIQVEHIDAVNNIESILAVDGIDAVLIGPYDLSGSLDQLGNVTHPDVQGAISKTFDACKAHDIPVGVVALAAEPGKAFLEKGYDFLSLGIDMPMLGNAARALLGGVR